MALVLLVFLSLLSSSCAFTVLGKTLTATEARWITYIGTDILPRLNYQYNNKDTALTQASYVAWWSLKEGVLQLNDPRPFSLCDPNHVVKTSDWAGACPSTNYNSWQVGIAGIQAFQSDSSANAAIPRLNGLAATTYPDRTGNVLSSFANEIGFGNWASNIANSQGMVKAAWLRRLPAVGFIEQAPMVYSQCIQSTPLGWCYSSAWYPSAYYSPNVASIPQAVRDVKAILASINSPNVPPPPPPANCKGIYVNSQDLNLRSCAGTKCSIVALIPAGTSVYDIGNGTKTADGYNWRNLQFGSAQGFSADSFLTFKGACATLRLS